MAKRKRRKRAPQLWAAKDVGANAVYVFRGKPTLEFNNCESCGQKQAIFQGDVVTDLCEPDFSKLTGIQVAAGEAVRLKVTRVEE